MAEIITAIIDLRHHVDRSIEGLERKIDDQIEKQRHDAVMEDAHFDRLTTLIIELKSMTLIVHSQMTIMTEEVKELIKSL